MATEGHVRQVRRPRLTPADLAAVPGELLEPVPNGHLHDVARDLAAGEIDRWLRVLSRREALCRRVMGEFAAVFLRQQAQHRLGFSRLGDYSLERLGVSARELQTAARVVTALATLPRLATAFDAGEISWTQLRILVTVATSVTEGDWLELARGRTVRALEVLVQQARTVTRAPVDAIDPATATNVPSEGVNPGVMKGEMPGEALSATADPAAIADETLIDGEPSVRFHLRCPRRVRRLWRRVVELGRRMLGTDGPVWQVAEAMAAEGVAAGVEPGEVWQSFDDVTAREDVTEGPAAGGARPLPLWECIDWSAVRAAIPEEIMQLADDSDEFDAFALDARLQQVLVTQRRIDWQLGRLLHTFLRLRLERALGFPSAAAYARERLGLSPSKVRGLVAVERKTWEVPAFGTAYETDQLSWVRALALLPVLAERTAAEWTERAQGVTVRRLMAEVEWSLDQWDADPRLGVPPGPPPIGRDLAAETEHQMRARQEWAPADAEISFAGPASVVALLQSVVASFRRPWESRWAAFERLLEHVAGEWEAQPRHRDPILARDGWRCAVPACAARSNLHDHHIQFRSQGGGNAHENRVTVCAWHHLRGIHAGLVRASGTAPLAVRWDLGLRSGCPPLLSFLGDAYVQRDEGASMVKSEEGSPAAA